MVVYEISCDDGHKFEGWFASRHDFDDQLSRGLVQCPICNSQRVRKVPTAAFLNTKTERKTGAEQSETIDVGALLMKVRAQVLTQSEDVGTRFAAEARKIHAGNAPERMIRGVVSRDEVVELLEEGVPVMPFPDPVDDNLH